MKQVIKKKIIETHNINVEQPILTVLFDMNSVMKMALVDKRVNSHGIEYGMVFQTLILMKKILNIGQFYGTKTIKIWQLPKIVLEILMLLV